MAVVDRYSDTTYINSAGLVITPAPAIHVGSRILVSIQQIAIAAADDDGSTFRFLKGLNSDCLMYDIKIACTAITAGTDYDLGLFLTDFGAVVAGNVFMDGQTMASAVDFGGATVLDGMDNVAPVDYGKTLWEYASQSMTTIPVTKHSSYDLVLTANTIGTAAGTVSIKTEYVNP